MDLKTIQTLQTQVDELLTLLGVTFVSASVEMVESDTVKVNISPNDNQSAEEDTRLGLLIGGGGETLAAIEYVLALMLNKGREEWLRVSVDIDGYRERREDEIRQLAFKMADKARATHRIVELKPMSNVDRRVVHMVLADDATVETESAGEGRDRHVVIRPISA